VRLQQYGVRLRDVANSLRKSVMDISHIQNIIGPILRTLDSMPFFSSDGDDIRVIAFSYYASWVT